MQITGNNKGYQPLSRTGYHPHDETFLLNKLLADLGYGVEVSGEFTRTTEKHLRAFQGEQLSRNEYAPGVANVKTMSRLFELVTRKEQQAARNLKSADGETAFKPIKRGADNDPDMVRKIQRALFSRGYDLGTAGPEKNGITGIFDRLTGLAVRNFQKEHGYV